MTDDTYALLTTRGEMSDPGAAVAELAGRRQEGHGDGLGGLDRIPGLLESRGRHGAPKRPALRVITGGKR
jgi:hypothetical protein